MRLLFVCLGNICRSPTAEGVMRHLLVEEGLSEAVEIDSAGTGDWHVGHAPDHRSAGAAADRGIELTGQARQVAPADFESYDLILAMDRSNHDDLLALAPGEEARERIRLLREYDPEAVAAGDLEVPDPYYGAGDGFEDVLDLVTRACQGLIEAEVRPRVA
jgi:protein-tyrosine phosphatase